MLWGTAGPFRTTMYIELRTAVVLVRTYFAVDLDEQRNGVVQQMYAAYLEIATTASRLYSKRMKCPVCCCSRGAKNTCGWYDTNIKPKRTSSLPAVSIVELPPAAPAGVALLLLVGFVAFNRKTLLPPCGFLAFFRPLFLSIVTLKWGAWDVCAKRVLGGAPVFNITKGLRGAHTRVWGGSYMFN